MPKIPVTAEMLASGRATAAQLAPIGVFTDAWWAAVYRAMRAAEPPVCRGEPVEILCGTTTQIEAAVERFKGRIERWLPSGEVGGQRFGADGKEIFKERIEHYLARPVETAMTRLVDSCRHHTPGTMSWPPMGSA